MNQEEHSFSKTPISVSFDDFEISAESFKPVTKGLGFHHQQKTTTFKPVARQTPDVLKSLGPLNNISSELEVKIKQQTPMGLEAFYGANPIPKMVLENEIFAQEKNQIAKEEENSTIKATALAQFSAWIIDLILIAALVAITATCLVLASGLDYSLILKLATRSDLAIFSGSVFSIYYILYFTVLELSTTPGKIIFGIHLEGTEHSSLSVRQTFMRSMVSLFSIFAFCLPMLLDFQGRLSDTKIVK